MSAATLLEAKALTRHYIVSRGPFKPKGLVRALDGVSFALAEKKTLAIVGESGCGKSTLARQVTMIETPTAGELWLSGVNLAEPTARKRARAWVQMVFQNPYGSLNPRKKVGAMLQEPLALNTHLSRAERAERAREMLAKVGLRPEHVHRYPHTFSGGQRQRIAIARALMVRPKVVVADEPVSALDVSVQGQILNLLADLQQDTGVAYLFISHNLAVVQHIADDVLVMYFGKVVERGPKRAIFATPAHPYTRALLASAPTLDARVRQECGALKGELPSPLNPPSGCPFHSRCPYVVERCRVEVPALRPFGSQEVACHRAEEIPR